MRERGEKKRKEVLVDLGRDLLWSKRSPCVYIMGTTYADFSAPILPQSRSLFDNIPSPLCTSHNQYSDDKKKKKGKKKGKSRHIDAAYAASQLGRVAARAGLLMHGHLHITEGTFRQVKEIARIQRIR